MNFLIGIWLYTSLIYNGHPLARPDPDLQMYFVFINSNENELFYYRKSQTGFCRRRATYRFESGKLFQKITSVDSGNAEFCSSDPDMLPDRESVSDLDVSESTMLLRLPLGDETLTYVWTRNQ